MLKMDEFLNQNKKSLVLIFLLGGCGLLAINPAACQNVATSWNNFVSFFQKQSPQTIDAAKQGASHIGEIKKRASGGSGTAGKQDSLKKEPEK